MIGVSRALDTSIAVHCINGNPAVVAHMLDLGPFALPAVVVGELLFGAMKSARSATNVPIYNSFIDEAIVLETSRAVASRYAELRLSLSRIGRPIPENDLWIAATCLHYELVLATADDHFSHCPGLRTENWLEVA